MKKFLTSLTVIFFLSALPVYAESEREYNIQTEDILEIFVWQNEELNREVVVQIDGNITLPLIGDLKAAGLAAQDLASRISRKLSSYITVSYTHLTLPTN